MPFRFLCVCVVCIVVCLIRLCLFVCFYSVCCLLCLCFFADVYFHMRFFHVRVASQDVSYTFGGLLFCITCSYDVRTPLKQDFVFTYLWSEFALVSDHVMYLRTYSKTV